MVSEKDTQTLWTAAELQKASKTAIEGLLIPTDQKEYLQRIGLPNYEHLLLTFELHNRIPTMTDIGGERNAPKEWKRLKVIGSEDGQPSICLDESQSGAVLSVDSKQKLMTRYVNSGVRELGLFLTVHKRDYLDNPKIPNLSEEEAQPIIDAIEKEFRSVDKSALTDPDNWWSVILEQMRDGML